MVKIVSVVADVHLASDVTEDSLTLQALDVSEEPRFDLQCELEKVEAWIKDMFCFVSDMVCPV